MANKSILIVEDEIIIAEGIKNNLEQMGYAVCGIAASGELAVEKSIEKRPDLVLMDIVLKGDMTGVDAAKHIHTQMDIPVVYLTAYADENTISKVKSSHPYGYILKPYQPRELHTTIEMALYKHQVSRKLRENERWLAAVLKSIGDGIIAADRKGRVTFMNPIAEALTGWKIHQAVQQPLSDVFRILPEDHDHKIINPAVLALREGVGPTTNDQCVLTSKDNDKIPVSVNASPIIEDNGDIDGVVLVLKDVSERKRLQQHIFQAKKLESVARLAGGIAHDFNNLLTSILGYASFMKAEIPESHHFYNYMKTIEEGAERAAKLTNKLLGFAQGGQYNIQPLNLNRFVADMLGNLRQRLPHYITLDTQYYKPGPIVAADALQFEQVLINLCENAVDAMPDGGTLTLRTDVVMIDGQHIPHQPESSPGMFATLVIKDTGIGMNEQLAEKIFEPFFTTKRSESGTGLGLAMAYGVVKNHGGFIRVESRPGRGSTFYIHLPFSKEMLPEEPVISDPASLRGTQETILIVDDVTSVRTFGKDLLENYGYRVLLARDGIEGLEMYQAYASEIKLVILDMIMPRMGGYEAFFKLKKFSPDVRVLVATGKSETSEVQEILRQGGMGFIQKPYLLEDFLTKVRTILDAKKDA